MDSVFELLFMKFIKMTRKYILFERFFTAGDILAAFLRVSIDTHAENIPAISKRHLTKYWDIDKIGANDRRKACAARAKSAARVGRSEILSLFT